ncbi:nucleolar protein 9 [Strongylocentrotus purpuratus]|uniref:Nucleolar protein 9 n=1 Tax=Strongylocentrotus purpuratus TaxID=7668 RepID=A0A7M7TG35_STRPU|nr:nucleolar protein 9 [Strongylocentrotus purpuratus]
MSKKTDKTKNEDDGTGRIGRLDEPTMGYYRRVSDKIQEGFENADEKAMFMRNVYSELEGNEIGLSQNQTVSRILETVLPLSEPEQLTSFLRGLTSDLSTSATDRFASHVLQSTMIEALRYVGTEEGVDLPGIFCTICKEMSENFKEVILDTYASHVLRTLIASLAGIQAPENVSRSKLSRGQQHKELVLETKVILNSPPKDFLSCVEKISETIMEVDDLNEYFTSATAGPVLEVLLLALHHTNKELCKRLTKIFLKQAKLLSKGAASETEKERSLAQLMTHPISSHLLEVIFKVIGDDLLLKVIGRSFKGQLIKLAMHGVANFVLQRLLERTKDLPVFEELFDEIVADIESVLAVNHLGVIQRLAAGCVSHTSKQVPFLQCLMKAFHCHEPRDRQNSCVPLFAAMVTYEVMFGEKDDTKEDPQAPPPIQLQGSLLLQEMLKFSKNGSILNSFMAMTPEMLVSMATHPSGSYLLEAFMKSTVIGEKKKDQYVEKFKGSCFQIACNKHGSRTIEGIFKASSIKSKFVIAETLAERESHLLSHTFGRFVHRNLSLGHLRNRKQEWKSIQMKEAQKRKLFADIVGREPPKKEKAMEEGRQEDMFSKEIAMLTGSGDSRLGEEPGEDATADNDEITTIFSTLSQKGETPLDEDQAHQTQGKKKKKKKRKIKDTD